MVESELVQVERVPVPIDHVCGIRRRVFRSRIANDVCAGVVRMLTGKGLEMLSHGRDDAARLHRVFPHHVQAAQEQGLPDTSTCVGAASDAPRKKGDEPAAQGTRGNVHHAPLELVDDDGPLQGLEHGEQSALE